MSRLAHYVFFSTIIFAMELGMLYLFTNVFGIYYVTSAGLSFVIAVTTNYFISRWYVFLDSSQSIVKGYIYFLLISAFGLGAVTSLMYVSVEYLGLNYLISRIIIAACVGMWGYLMNLYFNFRVGA